MRCRAASVTASQLRNSLRPIFSGSCYATPAVLEFSVMAFPNRSSPPPASQRSDAFVCPRNPSHPRRVSSIRCSSARAKACARKSRSMPGVFNLSVDEAVKECAEVKSLGIPSVILFGLPETKDEIATGAWADDGIVQQAARAIKREVPGLLLMGDVCLCEYMSHGHCGIVETDTSQSRRLARAGIAGQVRCRNRRSHATACRDGRRGLRDPQRPHAGTAGARPRSRRPRRAWTSSLPPT